MNYLLINTTKGAGWGNMHTVCLDQCTDWGSGKNFYKTIYKTGAGFTPDYYKMRLNILNDIFSLFSPGIFHSSIIQHLIPIYNITMHKNNSVAHNLSKYVSATRHQHTTRAKMTSWKRF